MWERGAFNLKRVAGRPPAQIATETEKGITQHPGCLGFVTLGLQIGVNRQTGLQRRRLQRGQDQ